MSTDDTGWAEGTRAEPDGRPKRLKPKSRLRAGVDTQSLFKDFMPNNTDSFKDRQAHYAELTLLLSNLDNNLPEDSNIKSYMSSQADGCKTLAKQLDEALWKLHSEKEDTDGGFGANHYYFGMVEWKKRLQNCLDGRPEEIEALHDSLYETVENYALYWPKSSVDYDTTPGPASSPAATSTPSPATSRKKNQDHIEHQIRKIAADLPEYLAKYIEFVKEQTAASLAARVDTRVFGFKEEEEDEDELFGLIFTYESRIRDLKRDLDGMVANKTRAEQAFPAFLQREFPQELRMDISEVVDKTEELLILYFNSLNHSRAEVQGLEAWDVDDRSAFCRQIGHRLCEQYMGFEVTIWKEVYKIYDMLADWSLDPDADNILQFLRFLHNWDESFPEPVLTEALSEALAAYTQKLKEYDDMASMPGSTDGVGDVSTPDSPDQGTTRKQVEDSAAQATFRTGQQLLDDGTDRKSKKLNVTNGVHVSNVSIPGSSAHTPIPQAPVDLQAGIATPAVASFKRPHGHDEEPDAGKDMEGNVQVEATKEDGTVPNAMIIAPPNNQTKGGATSIAVHQSQLPSTPHNDTVRLLNLLSAGPTPASPWSTSGPTMTGSLASLFSYPLNGSTPRPLMTGSPVSSFGYSSKGSTSRSMVTGSPASSFGYSSNGSTSGPLVTGSPASSFGCSSNGSTSGLSMTGNAASLSGSTLRNNVMRQSTPRVDLAQLFTANKPQAAPQLGFIELMGRLRMAWVKMIKNVDDNIPSKYVTYRVQSQFINVHHRELSDRLMEKSHGDHPKLLMVFEECVTKLELWNATNDWASWATFLHQGWPLIFSAPEEFDEAMGILDGSESKEDSTPNASEKVDETMGLTDGLEPKDESMPSASEKVNETMDCSPDPSSNAQLPSATDGLRESTSNAQLPAEMDGVELRKNSPPMTSNSQLTHEMEGLELREDPSVINLCQTMEKKLKMVGPDSDPEPSQPPDTKLSAMPPRTVSNSTPTEATPAVTVNAPVEAAKPRSEAASDVKVTVESTAEVVSSETISPDLQPVHTKSAVQVPDESAGTKPIVEATKEGHKGPAEVAVPAVSIKTPNELATPRPGPEADVGTPVESKAAMPQEDVIRKDSVESTSDQTSAESVASAPQEETIIQKDSKESTSAKNPAESMTQSQYESIVSLIGDFRTCFESRMDGMQNDINYVKLQLSEIPKEHEKLKTSVSQIEGVLKGQTNMMQTMEGKIKKALGGAHEVDEKEQVVRPEEPSPVQHEVLSSPQQEVPRPQQEVPHPIEEEAPPPIEEEVPLPLKKEVPAPAQQEVPASIQQKLPRWMVHRAALADGELRLAFMPKIDPNNPDHFSRISSAVQVVLTSEGISEPHDMAHSLTLLLTRDLSCKRRTTREATLELRNAAKRIYTTLREEVFLHRNWLDKAKVEDAVRITDQVCASVDLCSRFAACPNRLHALQQTNLPALKQLQKAKDDAATDAETQKHDIAFRALSEATQTEMWDIGQLVGECREAVSAVVGFVAKIDGGAVPAKALEDRYEADLPAFLNRCGDFAVWFNKELDDAKAL
ncbi:hypothetical protein BDV95DRAFT_336812 [Massariosphaeria phaeospora]|uniref:Uncharacterized protein n=1 Tax=Massariosphaeria phaeospora TaxID=100035 RepID=A0A7C8MG87_9PLEO|nr:hypothetical protein BDV95DRAFT_336812 [Massariosphaeria phaeospora]